MIVSILYLSKYGATAHIARRIADGIDSEVTLHDLKKNRHPDLSQVDVVLLGASIHAGQVNPLLGRLLESYKDVLLSKKVGVFLSCLTRGEPARAYLESSFPSWLLAHAFVKSTPGGYVRMSDLSIFDRFLMRKFAGQRGDIEALDEAEITLIVEAVKALAG